MRTLHVGLRVTDLGRSLAFYTAIGYEVVGSVPETSIGQLTMLKLPDDEFVTVELVHDGNPVDRGTDARRADTGPTRRQHLAVPGRDLSGKGRHDRPTSPLTP
jgi:catechol 2,3-dioxygenase-like lactoylglutathione lyase family enzyme